MRCIYKNREKVLNINYFNEIEIFIKKNEVSKKIRILEENQTILENYWNIGRLLVEAQGGKERARYGNGLIKEWSIKFTEKYGISYSNRNLMLYRQFYNTFPIVNAVRSQLTWTHIKTILPIKEINKRNYYVNLCIERNLSSRDLQQEIKNNSYERLIKKPDKIEIIVPQKPIYFLEQMKNPILIELDRNKTIQSEHDLEITILAKLRIFFSQLGEGFALIDNQYKINYNNKNYYIDILLFNYKLNCFFVVELKLGELRKEDKSQIEFYMQLMDNQIKEPFHNKTIGIIISKEQDKLIANFVKNDSIIPLTYEIKKKI